MRRAAKTDANQTQLVRALETLGCSVQSLAAIGAGCPDLLIGFKGRNYLVEVKNNKQQPSKRKLTPHQVVWHRNWRGHVRIVEDLDTLLRIVDGWRVLESWNEVDEVADAKIEALMKLQPKRK